MGAPGDRTGGSDVEGVLDAYREVGSLAAALREARYSLREVRRSAYVKTSALRSVERDLAFVLATLFPEWRILFPTWRSWFVAEDHVHVFGDGIQDSPSSADALHRAGFRFVTIHDHPCRTKPGSVWDEPTPTSPVVAPTPPPSSASDHARVTIRTRAVPSEMLECSCATRADGRPRVDETR